MRANYVKKMAEQAFNKLVEAVEAGKSGILVEYLKAMGKFHNYSIGNAILIGFQKPDATRVAGFRTWQKLGRFVKRNEKGIAIVAPIVWRKKEMHTDSEEDGQEHKEESAVAFKTAYVFDISQTDGKPLPEFARVRGDTAGYTERLKQFVSEQGIKLEYSDRIGSVEGISCGGKIKLKKGLSQAEEVSTLIHELTHEMLHRDKSHISKDKEVREIEAEAVAFVVCYGIGLDVNSASSDYIQLYQGDKNTLLESLDRIQKTSAEILTAIMQNNEPAVEYTTKGICSAAA